MSDSEGSDPEFLAASDNEDEVKLHPRHFTPMLLKLIEKNWINERIAPDLLPPMQAEIEEMMGYVRIIQEDLEELCDDDVRKLPHQLELDRVTYMITSYLRLRLAKIEAYSWHLLKEEEQNSTSRLMPQELNFLKDYCSITDRYLKSAGTDHMPLTCNDYNPQKFNVKPNLNSFVFLRVQKDSNVTVENPIDGGEEEVNLRTNSQHIMRYRPIADLLKQTSKDVVRLV